jgi:hypothetical protein
VCSNKLRAVEVSQPVLVAGEVRRDPVENHADALLVQVVDQVLEILRRAVAAAGGEVAGRLISPRPEERMLHDRQQFDVRETASLHMVGHS